VLGSPDMPASVFAAIAAIGAQPMVAERDFRWNVRADGHWSYRGPQFVLDDLPPSSLAGAIQYRNAATAIAAIEALFENRAPSLTLPREAGEGRELLLLPPPFHGGGAGWGRSSIATALESVQLKGRFQIIPGSIEWILDVAHNEPAARVLAMHLADRPCLGRTIAVISILGDKDIAEIGKALAPVIDHWALCSLQEPRGLPAAELARRLALPQETIALADSVAAGCELAQSLAKPGDRIVVCGSFLVVGASLQWLGL